MQMRRCDRGTILSRDNINRELYTRADKRYQAIRSGTWTAFMGGFCADARRGLGFLFFPSISLRNSGVSLNNAQRARITSDGDLGNKLYGRVDGGIPRFTTYPRPIDAPTPPALSLSLVFPFFPFVLFIYFLFAGAIPSRTFDFKTRGLGIEDRFTKRRCAEDKGLESRTIKVYRFPEFTHGGFWEN